MPESWATRLMRWQLNWFPAYRGTGARVIYIGGDWREVRICVPLSWRTRNYVGTIFGGSLYGGVDPVYMLMLIKSLGPEYVVWDKAASIRFRRPGRSRLFGTFQLTEDTLADIRDVLTRATKVDKTFTVDLVDAEGTVHASIEKVVHVSLRAQAGRSDKPISARGGTS